MAALPLGKSGVLEGRNATTYHLNNGKRQNQLKEFGANVITNQRIVIDGNVITSFCPETAMDVAFQLLRWLVGEEKVNVVARAMGY